jgi:hypothetical protein
MDFEGLAWILGKKGGNNYCQEQLIPRVGKEELLGLAQNFLTSISYLTLIGLFKF